MILLMLEIFNITLQPLKKVLIIEFMDFQSFKLVDFGDQSDMFQ